jgi:hypothetical protein
MKTVILFGGGDGGGLIMTNTGVRPIPPFDPGVLRTLKSASEMVKSVSASNGDRARGKKAKLATSLCNLAVEQLEEVVGPLDSERSLVFQDDDGGFYCGSTGKPPTLLPWPPRSMPSVSDLLATGVIESDLIELVQQAHARKVTLTNVLETPAEVAKELGVSLSERTANDLHILAPSRLTAIENHIEREVVGLFHRVVEDGRYLETWYSHPYEVSEALDVKISDEALEWIVTGGAIQEGPRKKVPDIVIALAVIVAIVVIGIVIATAIPAHAQSVEEIVKDRSCKAKI